MSYSTVEKTKRDGTLTFGALAGGAFDASGALNAGAESLVVAFETGDFNLSIPGPTVTHSLDRGVITSPPSIRYGDDQPMTFSFTALLRDLSDAAYATLEEIIMQSGYVASTWESTPHTNAEVQAYDLKWEIEGTNHGDAADHVIILENCVFTGSLQEGDPDSISISGTAYALYPTIIS